MARVSSPEDESAETGLDLISGIEPENEPDANWNGWVGYERAEEYAAVVSASSDGHADAQGRGRQGHPRHEIRGHPAHGRRDGVGEPGMLQPAILRWKEQHVRMPRSRWRRSPCTCTSAISVTQGGSDEAVQYGITFERQ